MSTSNVACQFLGMHAARAGQCCKCHVSIWTKPEDHSQSLNTNTQCIFDVLVSSWNRHNETSGSDDVCTEQNDMSIKIALKMTGCNSRIECAATRCDKLKMA